MQRQLRTGVCSWSRPACWRSSRATSVAENRDVSRRGPPQARSALWSRRREGWRVNRELALELSANLHILRISHHFLPCFLTGRTTDNLACPEFVFGPQCRTAQTKQVSTDPECGRRTTLISSANTPGANAVPSRARGFSARPALWGIEPDKQQSTDVTDGHSLE
jgi:hypothetical protein